ncbi:exonuclease domain-containing protein [Corynebacterium heidelbergense]|uniref:DNA polymerase III subunit epsilon n=1 Tax=Corynebacterium heidelbergense TaxID=2055947 RepID=A0A364V8Y0_9CORY|nr:exonuclease domain-containing protein [Corynebacterium heidelbergense]RAV33123.1 DNA polymerase III subunit epsilon [Corynebacterium heidelbergense]
MFGFGKKPGASRQSRAATGALADFYRVPAPAPSSPLPEVPFLAVDIETTGLDPACDSVLSIGWVAIDSFLIDASTSGYCVVNADVHRCAGSGEQRSVGGVEHSATIHGLTDDDIAAGMPPADALRMLLEALAGRVLLAHYSPIERDFLSLACKRHFGAGLDVPTVDTFALERRHMERMGTYARGEDLRLPRVRERYNLPSYSSHNALTDALACAELFLAQAAHGKVTTLKAVLER